MARAAVAPGQTPFEILIPHYIAARLAMVKRKKNEKKKKNRK